MAKHDSFPFIPHVQKPHVDEFIDNHRSDDYASFVLNWFRMPALTKERFSPWMKQFKLFATYNGERFRVTGASRLGDVWLATDHGRETGYDLRVNVEDLSNWGPEP